MHPFAGFERAAKFYPNRALFVFYYNFCWCKMCQNAVSSTANFCICLDKHRHPAWQGPLNASSHASTGIGATLRLVFLAPGKFVSLKSTWQWHCYYRKCRLVMLSPPGKEWKWRCCFIFVLFFFAPRSTISSHLPHASQWSYLGTGGGGCNSSIFFPPFVWSKNMGLTSFYSYLIGDTTFNSFLILC